jgi:hypothetical protein
MASIAEGSAVPPARPGPGAALFRGSAILLVAASWLSAALFGAYILAFYGGMALGGTPDRWNESLPRLHEAAAPLATLAIGAHFATGGILLLLGPIQLIGAIRRRVPAVHRWLGRLYVGAAGVAGIGGLGFILAKGTIGGTAMDLGFGLYGALTAGCALLTYYHGRARRIEAHRTWAVRLFALAIGSWLYRMEYGFWFLAAGKLGHTSNFDGGFDVVMDFFFYLPNLVVAEAFLRARRSAEESPARFAGALVLLASGFAILATWVFARDYWFPGMARGLAAVAG